MNSSSSANRGRVGQAALLCASLWLCSDVWAAGADPFKESYDRGLTLYDKNQYESALGEFESAYKLRQVPALMFNIAQTHRKLGHVQQALDFYERYLLAEPSMPAATKGKVQGYIEQLRQVQRSRQDSASTPPTSPVTPPATPATAAPTQPAAAPPVAASDPSPPAVAPSPQESIAPAAPAEPPKPRLQKDPLGRRLIIAGPVLASLGSAVLLIGGAVHVAANKQVVDPTQSAATMMMQQNTIDGLHNAANFGYIFGGLLLTGGLVMIGVGAYRLKTHPATLVTPAQ